MVDGLGSRRRVSAGSPGRTARRGPAERAGKGGRSLGGSGRREAEAEGAGAGGARGGGGGGGRGPGRRRDPPPSTGPGARGLRLRQSGLPGAASRLRPRQPGAAGSPPSRAPAPPSGAPTGPCGTRSPHPSHTHGGRGRSPRSHSPGTPAGGRPPPPAAVPRGRGGGECRRSGRTLGAGRGASPFPARRPRLQLQMESGSRPGAEQPAGTLGLRLLGRARPATGSSADSAPSGPCALPARGLPTGAQEAGALRFLIRAPGAQALARPGCESALAGFADGDSRKPQPAAALAGAWRAPMKGG
ncbi:collagen alpha-1(III) chain-like [Choloepus didactylus]|uniref:collagen alpha-1(III) chain-like n=1 Tax=Choloepus didactylus TaxID=27675 RepID=UPI00189F65F7|nr:collagen alpha-1(III) chain-like [Choloepus didactylus]